MEPPDTRLARPERVAVAADVLLGVALCALVALMVAVGLRDRADPNSLHGGAFAFLGAVLIGLSGLLFLLAAFAVRRRRRGRWGMHLLPRLAPVALYLFGTLGLLGG